MLSEPALATHISLLAQDLPSIIPLALRAWILYRAGMRASFLRNSMGMLPIVSQRLPTPALA